MIIQLDNLDIKLAKLYYYMYNYSAENHLLYMHKVTSIIDMHKTLGIIIDFLT